MNFGAKFRHAFAVDGEKAEPTPEQSAAVDAFARWVARRGLMRVAHGAAVVPVRGRGGADRGVPAQVLVEERD